MPKLKPTSFDYLVMALNPALVIALVGSLVFFLIEVFYEGEFQTRLCFIMACFTLGTVGITRIAIEFDAARASMYGLALSGAMLLVAPRFAEINLLLLIVLLAVIWYSAHRLTWDCTLIDEEQDASGEGLLQRIGLDEAPTEANRDNSAPKPPFWKRLFAPDKSKHAPGLTVVYFSLAALPIFGILQGFIPTSDSEARTRAFLSLIVYVGAGLGLLLTTSLLGLRRYLRQRQVEMPADMTLTWLAVGGGLIAVVLAFATVLPRSTREFQLGKSPITFTSREQTARNGGWGDEGARGDQKGNARNRNEQNENGAPGKDQQNGQQLSDQKPGGEKGDQGQGDNQKGQPQPGNQQGKGNRQQQGNGNDPSQKSGDQNQSDSSKNEPGKNDSRNDPNQQQGGDQKSPHQKGPDQKDNNQQGAQKQPNDPNQKQNQPGEKSEGEQNQKQPGNQQQNGGQQNPQQRQQQPNGQPRESPQNQGNGAPQQRPQSAPSNFKVNFDPSATVPFLGWLLKVLIFVVIAVVLIYCAIRYRREFLAALKQMLAELATFWRSLFGGRGAELPTAELAPVVRHRRFADIANPFRKGGAGHNPRELVQETFSAMEAWARDHGYPREKEQTAFEFADALSLRVTDLAKESKWLADCYSRAAYSSEEVSAQVQSSLAAIWQRMEQLYGRIPPPAPPLPSAR